MHSQRLDAACEQETNDSKQARNDISNNLEDGI